MNLNEMQKFINEFNRIKNDIKNFLELAFKENINISHEDFFENKKEISQFKYRYSTKQGQFETNVIGEISLDDLHSLNDQPAFEDLITGHKRWCFEGKLHRENGPAAIWPNGNYDFWLNGNRYKKVNEWLADHQNKDENFQNEMREKYSK